MKGGGLGDIMKDKIEPIVLSCGEVLECSCGLCTISPLGVQFKSQSARQTVFNVKDLFINCFSKLFLICLAHLEQTHLTPEWQNICRTG